jgi:amino acid transporter
MAGCMGLIESTFFLAVSMLKFGQALTIVCQTHIDFEFLWWCWGYLMMVYFHVVGGKNLWNFVAITTTITFVGLLIYVIGSVPAINISKHAYQKSGFENNPLDYLIVLRLPCWLFVGTDCLSSSSEEVKKVRV